MTASPGAGCAAVLFDFGGTLDADGATWKERVFRLYVDEGVAVTPEGFAPLFDAADAALTGAVPPTLSFRDTVQGLARGVTEALGRRDPGLSERVAARFVADALERLRHNARLLRKLAERYRLGVVSNFYGNLATVCADAGIRPLFATLVDSGQSGYVKPDPRSFGQALRELDVAPAQAVFVGDSLQRDMGGARAVGMPHIWLTPRPPAGETACCPGDRVIHALDEVEALLL